MKLTTKEKAAAVRYAKSKWSSWDYMEQDICRRAFEAGIRWYKKNNQKQEET